MTPDPRPTPRRATTARAALATAVLAATILAGAPAARADIVVTDPGGGRYWVRASCATDTITAYVESPAVRSGSYGFSWVPIDTVRPFRTAPAADYPAAARTEDGVAGGARLAAWRGSLGYRLLVSEVSNPKTPVPVLDLTRRQACPAYETLATTALRPLTPRRVLDTRAPGTGYAGDRPAAGAVVPVPLDGLPAGTAAVVLTVTVTEPAAPGYVQALPSGSTRTGAWSNLNVDGAGRTVANTVVVPVGPDGRIALYTSTPAHLLADLTAVFVAAPDPVSGGRFRAATPSRLLDTRAGTRPGDGGRATVRVAGGPGQPDPSEVSAVVVNVTATESAGPGYVQAAAGGALVPGATSILNLERADQTVASLAVVPVAADGTIELFTLAPTHLLVDLVGWFTSDAVPAGTGGRFVAVPPERVLDTRARSSVGCCWGNVRVPTGFQPDVRSQNDLYFGGLAVPSLDALLLNVTATDAAGPGYVAADAAGSLVEGATSVLNVTAAGATVANAAIVAVGQSRVTPSPSQPPTLPPYEAEGITMFSFAGSHLVVDLFGFFT